MHYVYQAIEYKADDIDRAQTPGETQRLQTGDCEDFCNLFWWLCLEQGIICELLSLRNYRTGQKHMIAHYQGLLYDITEDKIYLDIPEGWDVAIVYALGRWEP